MVRRVGAGLHTGFQGCAAQAGLAGHVQDGVGFVWVLLQFLDSFYCRQDEEFNFAALGFLLHLIHHGQCAGPGADDEPTASPGDLLFDGERRVAEGIAELLDTAGFWSRAFSGVQWLEAYRVPREPRMRPTASNR